MSHHGRAQCLVVRDSKILMVKHRVNGQEYYCLPGGGIEDNETPDIAAIRELQEECLVTGTIIKKTSEYPDPYGGAKMFYTYHIDIGDQTPSLGEDPEIRDNPILIGVAWLALDEMSERDRGFLWSAGLICIEQFSRELESWSDDISYPGAEDTRF